MLSGWGYAVTGQRIRIVEALATDLDGYLKALGAVAHGPFPGTHSWTFTEALCKIGPGRAETHS